MNAPTEGAKKAASRLVLWIFAASVFLAICSYTLALFSYCDPIGSKQIYCAQFDDFWSFFNTNIRASLFAGFLSLGGFLLSLKTFIVVNMKKDVFDTEKYKATWESQSKLDRSGKIGKRYDPLRELSSVLFAAIITAIGAAVMQITIGLRDSFWTTFFCLWAAAFATMLLLACLWLIKSNLNTMFSHLDD